MMDEDNNSNTLQLPGWSPSVKKEIMLHHQQLEPEPNLNTLDKDINCE